MKTYFFPDLKVTYSSSSDQIREQSIPLFIKRARRCKAPTKMSVDPVSHPAQAANFFALNVCWPVEGLHNIKDNIYVPQLFLSKGS